MIFICFSHVERYIVAQSLSYHLKNYGYKIWYDYDELFIGDDGDYLNFERGLYKSRYVVVIISHALFESPCAISELEQIYELLKNKKIVVIPILYNITAKDVPEKFQWINDIIYTEITTEKGTLDVATQISAKYLEDIIRDSGINRLDSVIIKPGKYSDYLTTDIDTTRNVWEAVLKRMEGTFVKIIENKGVRQIGAINPSVNDFLKNYLDENEPEVEEIGRNATEYIQIVRGFGPDIVDIVRSGDASKYNFKSDVERQLVILSNICELGICMEQYRDIVRTFVESLPYAFCNEASIFTVVPSLLSEPLAPYYGTREHLSSEELEDLLDSMDFDDFCVFEENLKNNGLELCELVDSDVVLEKLDKAMRDYIDGYDRSESYTNQDTYELFKENTIYNGAYHEVDVDKVVNILADCVRDDIYDDVTGKLAVFPRAITDDIDLSRYDIRADTGEIESYVCDVLADPGDRDYGDFYDGDSSYSGHLDGMDELDFIFAE